MFHYNPAANAVPVEPSLETLEEDHAIQLVLCRDLEALADGLPGLPGLPGIRRLCDRIICVVDTHFDRAEQALAALPPAVRPGEEELERLREMHLMDSLHGHDLVVALWQHAAHQGHCGTGRAAAARPGVGQLGYMLRCFFDGCRRAMALKESWRAAARRAGVGLAVAAPASVRTD